MTAATLTAPEIRASRDDDIPAITAIYGEAVLHGTGSFELAPPGEGEMAARRAALLDAGYPHIVALREGAVIGYAYAGAYRPRPAYAGTVESSVYIQADARGGGVGRALMSHLIAECEARDFRQMVAVVGDSANRASIALHEALGFTMVGTVRSVGWKHGRWLDTVLMQRALGPGDGQPPIPAQQGLK